MPLLFSFLSTSGPARALVALAPTGHSIRRLWSENQDISLLHGENTHETSLFIVLVYELFLWLHVLRQKGKKVSFPR